MPIENTALGDLYTEVIGEHSRSPENKGELAAATVRERGHNPSCGDEITLELQIEDGIIKDAAFTGVGCAISQASTDIMIDLMRGKTVEEAQRLAQLFTSMIKREVTDDAALEELVVVNCVRRKIRRRIQTRYIILCYGLDKKTLPFLRITL